MPSQNSADLSTKSSHTLDVAKGNTGNMVSCTILLNDMEKKCDLLLQGNQLDENFSDKDKPNTDESSNAVEFVYKKNRNSSATKSGGGGGGGGGNVKSRQKQNYGNLKIFSTLNCRIEVIKIKIVWNRLRKIKQQ